MENTTPNGWDTIDTSSDSTSVERDAMHPSQKYGATLHIAQSALKTLEVINDPRFTIYVRILRESLESIQTAPFKFD
jgi:hypothetical protein